MGPFKKNDNKDTKMFTFSFIGYSEKWSMPTFCLEYLKKANDSNLVCYLTECEYPDVSRFTCA